MQKKAVLRYAVLLMGVVMLFPVSGVYPEAVETVSGELADGYRLLPVGASAQEVLSFTVYRGDYIKFKLDPSIVDPVLSIPDLSIEETLPASLAEAPYLKMKSAGTFNFTLGELTGKIKVIEYRRPNYREVTALEAADLIRNIRPLILDVRTAGEYKSGHIANATLIPVQELQARYKEIAAYKNQDIFIYCATGNRSTVASKILIDNGFKRIFNLRYGIVDWGRKKFPIVR